MFDAPTYHTLDLGTEYEKIQLKNLIQEMVDPMADSNTVPHEVWINNSTEDRISIAFNLGIVQDEL